MMMSTVAEILNSKEFDGKIENVVMLPIKESEEWAVEAKVLDKDYRLVNIYLVDKTCPNYGSGAPNHVAKNYDTSKMLTSTAINRNIMSTRVLTHTMTAGEQVAKNDIMQV